MLHLNNDSKIQMRLNIQRHRQKLLQCLENSNDTILKPKIKSVSNNLKKFNLNNNVKPIMTSSTELISSKIEPTKVTNDKTRSYVQRKQFKPVITTKKKNLEVLTVVDTKNYETRSSDTLNQLQTSNKVNIQAELPISNVELKSTLISTIEKKDSEPPENVLKKLKEQLIEELSYCSSSEDTISVGSTEFSEINNVSDVHYNDSSYLIPVGVDKYNEHEQPDNENSLYYNCDGYTAQFATNTLATKKKSRTRKIAISTNPQDINNKPIKKAKKSLDRTMHNAKEKLVRNHMAQCFDTLKKTCSYLNSNRRIPSKQSILLSAKKECDLLKHFQIKLIREKKLLLKANKILKKRIAELIEMTK